MRLRHAELIGLAAMAVLAVLSTVLMVFAYERKGAASADVQAKTGAAVTTGTGGTRGPRDVTPNVAGSTPGEEKLEPGATPRTPVTSAKPTTAASATTAATATAVEGSSGPSSKPATTPAKHDVTPSVDGDPEPRSRPISGRDVSPGVSE
jgi:hypothetical protein